MNEEKLRRQLADALAWGDAHMSLETAITEFPARLCAASVPGKPHTPWRLLEHMRIAQWDILEFCRDPEHVSPDWPEGYWPEEGRKGTREEWKTSARGFLSDLRAFQALVTDPERDLLAEIPHGTGQTLLREVLLSADHSAYHLGQLMFLWRVAEAREE